MRRTYKPRHLLHGVVAAVGVTAALASIVVSPRVSVPAAAMAATTPATTDLLLQPLQPAVEPSDSAAADASPTPAPAPEPKAAPPKPSVHTVEEGETIRELADRFGISPDTILTANNLRDPDLLRVGQDLVILPADGVLYTLRTGESIRRVADRFGVDPADIVSANDLGDDPNVVQPGTLLVVPGGKPIPAARGQVTVVRDDDGGQRIAAVGPGVGLGVDVTDDAANSTRTYEVQQGDTLNGIASMFGIDVPTILGTNGIDNPNTIKPGSELRILPVKGVEYTVQPDETLADISWKWQVDLGILLDYNDLNDPDVIRSGFKLVVPGGRLRPEAIAAPAPAAAPAAPAARAQTGGPSASVSAPAASRPAASAPAPAARPAAAPAPAAPAMSRGGGGGTIVANAMKYVGYRYVFGGTSPAGFDCSGFVYYIHNNSGSSVGRGMLQQYNGGPRISQGALQPGDTVFFANTYMPGLSHDGIYIGGGQFVHASDERTGVTISSMNSGYWASKYVGAARLY